MTDEDPKKEWMENWDDQIEQNIQQDPAAPVSLESVRDLIEDRFQEMEERMDRIEAKTLSWWGLVVILGVYFLLMLFK